MGSGFVPSGIYGAVLGNFAGILAETDAYEAFVGATIAADGASGMYFYGIDRRELGEDFPAAYVVWDWAEDFGRYSTTGGGRAYKNEGQIILSIEADTPAAYLDDTHGAMNWIANHASAMVGDMEKLFGVGGRALCLEHKPFELPDRIRESGKQDDFVGMSVIFTVHS